MSKKSPGIVQKKGRWYYRPTSERERLARAAQQLPETIPLGLAHSAEACAKYLALTGQGAPAAAAKGLVLELLDGWVLPDEHGRPAPGAPIWTRDNGKKRAPGTVGQYAWIVKTQLKPRFGAMRYGRTAIEAAAGRAIGLVDVQQLVADIGTTSANVVAACLSSVFMWAKRKGRTTYNPCEGVATITAEGRDREALPWEVEVLGALAEARGQQRESLMLDFVSISGWSGCDMRNLVRRQLTPECIKSARQKTGARQRLMWTEDLRRIVDQALELPGARRAGVFPLSPVFASRSGGKISGPAFWQSFSRLIERVNEMLAAGGVIDPDTLERLAAPAIEDLGFHDLRSKAGDDAADDGQAMHQFLGNTPAVADKHYARRGRKVVPLTLKRKLGN